MTRIIEPDPSFAKSRQKGIRAVVVNALVIGALALLAYLNDPEMLLSALIDIPWAPFAIPLITGAVTTCIDYLKRMKEDPFEP